MNGIFFTVITVGIAFLCVKNPQCILSTVSSASGKAISLSVQMLGIYAFWLGIINLMEQSNINTKTGKILTPVVKGLFGKTSDDARKYITLNLSANLLGMGGIATPMGINAITELDKDNNLYAEYLLTVIATTSIQLLPTSVLSLRASMGSQDVNAIILPTLLSTFVSTLTGILLVKIFYGKHKK